MEDLEQRKLLSALCHGSIFLSSFIVPVVIPIAILFVTNDSVVKANAREAINFFINLYIYAIVGGILLLVLVGGLILFLLAIASVVMPIIALVQVVNSPEQPYRYPFIFHLV